LIQNNLNHYVLAHENFNHPPLIKCNGFTPRHVLYHALLSVAIGLTSFALHCTHCSMIVTIYSTNPAHPILVTILQLPPMRTTLCPLFGYQQPPPAPNIVALLGAEHCTIVTNYSLNLALSTLAPIPPLLPTQMTLPSLLDSQRPPLAPNIFQPICPVTMMSTRNASDKARQLREKQAAEMENASKMEQQRLKWIANKKQRS
jgi:hypothetical protein